MANISSINGNPIVVGTDGISDGAATDAKLEQKFGVLAVSSSAKYSVLNQNTNGNGLVGNFAVGVWDATRTTFATYVKYRIENYSPIHFVNSAKITSDEGWYIHLGINGEEIENPAWAREYDIPADSDVFVRVRRGTEDTSETADIGEFLSHVHASTELSDTVSTLLDDMAEAESEIGFIVGDAIVKTVSASPSNDADFYPFDGQRLPADVEVQFSIDAASGVLADGAVFGVYVRASGMSTAAPVIVDATESLVCKFPLDVPNLFVRVSGSDIISSGSITLETRVINSSRVSEHEDRIESIEKYSPAVSFGESLIEGKFYHGWYETSLSRFFPERRHRIATVEPVEFGTNCTLRVNGGYRLYLQYVDDEGNLTPSGWITRTNEPVFIEKGTRAYVAISEEGENNAGTSTSLGVMWKNVEPDKLLANLRTKTSVSELYHMAGIAPDYWVSKTLERIYDILDWLDTCDDGFCFGFISDTHYNQDAMKSFGILKTIDKHVQLSAVLHGGDFTIGTGYSSKEELLRACTREISRFASLFGDKFLLTAGNHEWGTIVSNEYINQREKYNRIYRFVSTKAVFPDTWDSSSPWAASTWYYCDDERYKVRYISLDSYEPIYRDVVQAGSGYSQRQLQWMVDAINEVGAKSDHEEWDVIVFTHSASFNLGVDAYANLDSMYKLLSAAKNGESYSITGTATTKPLSMTGSFPNPVNIIGVFCGHLHDDGMEVNEGIQTVVVTSDARGWWNAGSIGTFDELAFDIVCIDKVGRRAKLFRVGVGEDRTFTF